MSSTTSQNTSIAGIGGLFGVLTGILALLYSIAFVVITRTDPELGGLLRALFLMLGGLASIPLLVAVYNRLQRTDAPMALLALLMGIAGSFGAAVHGGYDLGNAINPPGPILDEVSALPSQFDPRALLTFGVAGLGMIVVSWLIVKGQQFPKSLGYIGYLFGVLTIILYLGRLIILTPTSPIIVIPALITGFLVSPIWNIGMGFVLWKGLRTSHLESREQADIAIASG